MNLNDLIDAYYDARAKHDALDAEKGKAYGVMKARERALIDAMLDEGTASIRRDDGTTVSLRKQLNFSCTKENFDDIRAWLVEKTGDDSDFVEEVVSKSSLTELLKTEVDQGIADDEFPPFLKVSTRPGVSVRGWSKR